VAKARKIGKKPKNKVNLKKRLKVIKKNEHMIETLKLSDKKK
jgi:hypothetical protein